MADNVAITAGSGTTIAADDIGGVLHQRVKLSQGADGVAVDVSASAPLQVSLANTGANATPLVVDLGANNDVTVTGSVAVTGTFYQATQPVSVATVPSHDVTNLGTFAVQESGGALTALQIMDDWDNGASDGASVSGDVAHGTADAGEPVKIGGKALSADPTAEATGDRVNALFDLIGRQVTFPYSLKENLVSGAITTAMTGTTSTSLIAAPGAGLFNYITQITVSNAHGTVGTDVAIQDGSGGTTIYTIPAAAVYGGAVVTFPAPLKQPTSNTALFCANVTTGASTKVSASGFKST